MKILDNLKNIFDTKFSDIFKNNKFTLFDFSKNQSTTLEVKEGGILSIDLSEASPEEQRKLKEGVIDVVVQQNEDVLLSDKSKLKTTTIKNNLPDETDKRILDFYKDKLNPDMYKALELSLIVKNAFRNGDDITELKRDISSKYPEFGNNICNMVTEGYFDDHFKGLYSSMFEEDSFDIRNYQKKVEKIVKSLPYTVFVNKYKKLDETSGEVNFKLNKLIKYGTGRLLLHALGRNNVDTALKVIEEYKDDPRIYIEIEINKSKTYLTATFKF